MTQLSNNYSEGQQTYPVTEQKAQTVLTVWEGGEIPVHGSIYGLTFVNVVNNNGGNGEYAGGNITQESGGQAVSSGTLGTCCCYYCKK